MSPGLESRWMIGLQDLGLLGSRGVVVRWISGVGLLRSHGIDVRWI